MATTRRAEVSWEGDLMSGKGTVTAKSSAAFSALPVSWASRTENADGRTSPEELVASAHASCFAMALSGGLGRGGTPPQKLEVAVVITFDKIEAGWRITRSDIEVKGWVPGLDAAGFTKAAEGAKEGCPISNALKGNVAFTVKATLA
jgi:osmotically inducible protein OsmC